MCINMINGKHILRALYILGMLGAVQIFSTYLWLTLPVSFEKGIVWKKKKKRL